MALTPQELDIAKRVKEQGGSREDFVEILQEFRNRQTPTTTTESVAQEPVTTEPEISGLDIGVKAGKGLSEFGEAFKMKGEGVPTTGKEVLKTIGRTIANIPGDAVEATGEVIELLSDPIGTAGAVKTASKGFIEAGLNNIFQTKVGQSILRGLGAPEKNLETLQKEGFFTEEKNRQVVEAVKQQLNDNFGDVDKATNTISENPVDTLLFMQGVLKTIKKIKKVPSESKLGTLEKTIDKKLKASALEDVQKGLGTTKEKFKQKGRELAPEILERRIGGSKEQIKDLAEAKAGEFGLQIEDFIKSGKLKGTVKRDDLLDVLDKIRKEGQIGDNIVDESIVAATDKFADIISGFGKEIPAEKARIVRQMFDNAVYNTKGIVSEEALSLKNNIKKGLADNIRHQLGEQNPDLAKLNKEFSFYSTLDDVLTETLNRVGPQQGGLTGNIAAGGGLAGGAAIFGDLTGAIATAAVAKTLQQAMKSTRWKLLKASLKNDLANALATGNKNTATSMAIKIIKEIFPEKKNLFIGGQLLESNQELNQK